MRIGFTGTLEGLTKSQGGSFIQLVEFLGITEFEHGDALGADCESHNILLDNNILKSDNIFKRPCYILNKRAFTKEGSLLEEPIAPIERNHKIVNEIEILIGCPKGFEEELRSGTWATIRYAKKTNKLTYIIYPDGSIIEINSGTEKEFVIPHKESNNEITTSATV